MRHVLRLLGSRYGVAFSLVVLIALIVGIGKAVGGSRLPTSGSGRVGIATPTTTASEQSDDGLGSPPPPPAPSTSPGAADPRAVALSFTQAWLHHTGVTSRQWLDGLTPYSTPALRAELDGADPGTVQASAVQGSPSVVNRSESFVQVMIPLDSGALTLGLSATDGRWLVNAVDWSRP